jgi:hypothetical protein
LREEIERLRRGGAKEAVQAETRRVCELLTGRRYEALYPRQEEAARREDEEV